MDDRTISNLQTHIVNVPGGRDKEERCVIAVHVPQQCNNLDVSSTLTYIISIFRCVLQVVNNTKICIVVVFTLNDPRVERTDAFQARSLNCSAYRVCFRYYSNGN